MTTAVETAKREVFGGVVRWVRCRWPLLASEYSTPPTRTDGKTGCYARHDRTGPSLHTSQIM